MVCNGLCDLADYSFIGRGSLIYILHSFDVLLHNIYVSLKQFTRPFETLEIKYISTTHLVYINIESSVHYREIHTNLYFLFHTPISTYKPFFFHTCGSNIRLFQLVLVSHNSSQVICMHRWQSVFALLPFIFTPFVHESG